MRVLNVMKALKYIILGSYRNDDRCNTVVRIEALWYRLSGILNADCAQHSRYGTPCIAAYMLRL